MNPRRRVREERIHESVSVTSPVIVAGRAGDYNSLMKFSIERGVRILAIAAMAIAPGVAETRTLTGYLIDKACSAETMAKGKGALAKHDKACALMGECRKSGYGAVTDDGKFIAFDAAGNKRALAAFKASKKEMDYKVTVTGDQQGDVIKVTSLKVE